MSILSCFIFPFNLAPLVTSESILKYVYRGLYTHMETTSKKEIRAYQKEAYLLDPTQYK